MAAAADTASTLLRELSFWELPTSSQLSGSKTAKQEAQQPAEVVDPRTCNWKTAVDPATGKTYYYDAITRKTQWEKPREIRLLEKRRKQEKRDRDIAFFRIMEENIRQSLERGERVPGVSIETPVFTEPAACNKKNKPRVRTISGMNEHWLKELSPRTSTSVIGGSNNSVGGKKPLLPPRTPVSRDDNEDLQQDSPPGDCRTSHSSSDEDEDDEMLRGVDFVMERHVRRNTYDGRNVPDSTMDQPDIQATIRTVCGVIRAHILQSKNHVVRNVIPNVNLCIFSDSNTILPSVQDVHDFYVGFYRRSQMEFDAIILSLIYVERLIKETEGALMPSPDNWQSLLFSCMVLASKVWDDLSMWNIDFSNVSGSVNFNLQRINELERAVLKCLNYAVIVPASEYAKYYYLLRNMMIRGGMLEASAAVSPQADRLQDRTSRYQAKQLQNKRGLERRARSVDWSQSTEPVLKEAVCLEQLVAGH